MLPSVHIFLGYFLYGLPTWQSFVEMIAVGLYYLDNHSIFATRYPDILSVNRMKK